MPKAKRIVLDQKSYSIAEAVAVLKVPAKTMQGAVTRGDMGKRGLPKSILPKKDKKGTWHLPARGLARWFNELYHRRPEGVEAEIAAKPACEPAAG